jgi:nitric oxide synthase-interacting protein
MARKSKSQSSRPFFTSNERDKAKAAGSGTTTARLGVDSQLAFGQCGLCLSFASRDPVATPQGYLYCRECILTNLLEQKKTLELQRQAYVEEQEELRAQQAAKATEAQLEEARKFATIESGVGSGLAGAGSSSSSSSSSAEAASVAALQASRAEKMDSRSRAEQVEDAKATSFWAPTAVPEASKTRTAAPDPCPRDPMGGDFLRAKQLISVKLTKMPEARLNDEAVLSLASSSSSSSSTAGAVAVLTSTGEASTRTDSGSGVAARFICPCCSKGLSVQKVYLLACGDVICGDCCKRFVVPSKRCYTCNLEVKKDGIWLLKQGGSSYAGHDGTVVTASKYNPTLLC